MEVCRTREPQLEWMRRRVVAAGQVSPVCGRLLPTTAAILAHGDGRFCMALLV